jgi:uncharacterized membrane protein
MNFYTLGLFVHVFAAATLIGGSLVAAPLVRTAAIRAGTRSELLATLTVGRPLALLNPLSSLVVLASGLYLTRLLHMWSLAWVQLAIVTWVANVLVARGVVAPHMARLGGAVATAPEGGISPEVDGVRRAPRWRWAADVLIANDAAVLLMMTTKPAWPVALGILAVAHLVPGAFRVVRGTLAVARAGGRRAASTARV